MRRGQIAPPDFASEEAIFRRQADARQEKATKYVTSHASRLCASKEALIQSMCADLRQKFLLTRKKIPGILTDFKIFFWGPREIGDFVERGRTNAAA